MKTKRPVRSLTSRLIAFNALSDKATLVYFNIVCSILFFIHSQGMVKVLEPDLSRNRGKKRWHMK